MQNLARTSSLGTAYSAAQVQGFLLSQILKESWNVWVLNPNLSFRFDLTPYVDFESGDAKITHDATADGKRMFEFTLRGDAPINVLSDLLQPQYNLWTPDGGYISFSLGRFTLSPWDKDIHVSSTWRKMKCPDLSQFLIDSTLTSTFSVFQGNSYIAAINALVSSYGGLTPIYINIPSPGISIPQNFSWKYGTTRLKVINDLLASINYWPAWFDEYGTLRSSPKPDFNVTPPSFIFNAMPPSFGVTKITQTYASTVAGDRPVAYYRLDDIGATAADSTSNRFSGLLSGAVQVGQPGGLTGDSDTSMGFDGSTSGVTVPYSSILNPSVFSIEALVKVSSIPPLVGGSGMILNTFQASSHTGFRLNTTHNSQFGFSLGDGVSTFNSSSFIFSLNIWYHLVGVYDGANLLFYVNGVQFGAPIACGYVPTASGDLGIGFNAVNSLSVINGSLDECAIYNYALTPGQIANHYQIVSSGPASISLPATPTTQQQSIVMIPIKDKPDVSKIFNECLVVIEDPRRSPQFAFYKNIQQGNPISVYNWHPKTKVIKHSHLPFGTTPYLIAKSFVQQSSLLFESLEMDTFPWAVSQDYDFYQLIFQTADEGLVNQKYIEQKWEHRLMTGKATTHTFQRVYPT